MYHCNKQLKSEQKIIKNNNNMFLKKQYLQTKNNPKRKPRPLEENDHGAQLNGGAPKLRITYQLRQGQHCQHFL